MLKLLSLCLLLIFIQILIFYNLNGNFTQIDLEILKFEWHSSNITKLVKIKELQSRWQKINQSKDALEQLNDERIILEIQLNELIKNHNSVLDEQKNLQNKLLELKDQNNDFKGGDYVLEPSFQYEILRRRVKKNLRNYFNFLVHDVKTMLSQFEKEKFLDKDAFFHNIKEFKL